MLLFMVCHACCCFLFFIFTKEENKNKKKKAKKMQRDVLFQRGFSKFIYLQHFKCKCTCVRVCACVYVFTVECSMILWKFLAIIGKKKLIFLHFVKLKISQLLLVGWLDGWLICLQFSKIFHCLPMCTYVSMKAFIFLKIWKNHQRAFL